MPTASELRSLVTRAVVTFLQVAIAVLVAEGLGSSAAEALDTAETAAVAGIGAVLSVAYNYLSNLGSRLEGTHEG